VSKKELDNHNSGGFFEGK